MFDDHLGLVGAGTPDERIDKASRLLDIVVSTFQQCGLRPNLKAGKTEVALHLVGKGARRARALLFSPDDKRHYLSTPDGAHRVQAVRRYRHLGTLRDVSGSSVPDARAKASACTQAYLPIAHRILGNAAIYERTRHSLASSLCFSRLRHGTDTWLDPSSEAIGIVHAARLRVLHQVAGCCRFSETGHGSDSKVLDHFR